MKNSISFLIIVILSSLILSSCSVDDDNNNDGDQNYEMSISNPLNGYTVALGSKVLLTVFSGDFNIDNVDFFIDNNSITISSEDNDLLFQNHKGFYWQANGITTGNHTLKAVAYYDGDVVASDEINITIIQPKWEKIDLSSYVGENYTLTDIHLLDNNTGWVSGNNGFDSFVLKTYDKGASWQVKTSNGVYWKDIAFEDGNNGLAIDYYFKELYRLENEGSSSFKILDDNGIPIFDSSTISLAYNNVQNEACVVATRYSDGFECIYKIDISNQTITSILPIVTNNHTNGAFNLRFENNKGIIYSMENDNGNQYVYLTDNNGTNWYSKELPPPSGWLGGTNNYQISGADIYNDNSIWVVGGDSSDYQDALTYHSSDGGNSWAVYPFNVELSFNSGAFNDVAAFGNSEAYSIIGSFTDQTTAPKMYHTNDDGNSWKPVYEVSSVNSLSKIEFIGQDFGIVIGDEGELYRYINK